MSGELPGQSSTRTSHCARNSQVVCALCAGARFCINIQGCPLGTQSPPSVRISCRTCFWYWAAFMLPYISFKRPRFWYPIAHHTWTWRPDLEILYKQQGLNFSWLLRVTNQPWRLYETRNIFRLKIQLLTIAPRPINMSVSPVLSFSCLALC